MQISPFSAILPHFVRAIFREGTEAHSVSQSQLKSTEIVYGEDGERLLHL